MTTIQMGGPALVRAACALCIEAHAGQIDAHGAPYAAHPVSVASKVAAFDDDPVAIAAAYLHDVMEDADVTADDLLEKGFPREVVDAVCALTREDGETYAEYIDRVSRNDVAAVVKLADIEDNLDTSRGPVPGGLRKRYIQARSALVCARTASLFGKDSREPQTGSDLYLQAVACNTAFEMVGVAAELDEVQLSALAKEAVCDPDCPPIVIVAVCEVLRTIDTDDLCDIVRMSAGNPDLARNRAVAASTDTPLGSMLAAVMRT